MSLASSPDRARRRKLTRCRRVRSTGLKPKWSSTMVRARVTASMRGRSAVFAREQGHRLPEQDSSHPAGGWQHGRIGGYFTLQAGAHDLEELAQAFPPDLIEAGLPAEVGQGQAFPQPALHAIAAVAQD